MRNWRDIDEVGRVAPNHFTPGEVAAMSGLSQDLQRVWRRRGHLPPRAEGHATFDARDVAGIAVRHELARLGLAPVDTAKYGIEAAPIVLYFALLSSDGAADLRGGLKRIAKVAQRLANDDHVAKLISEVERPHRYIWSASPPTLEFADDFGAILLAESFPAMLVLDLAVIGRRLVANNPKPLFLIDVAG